MAREERDTQNWGSLSIGIVTFATILAAATSAGIFAVAAELFGSEQSKYTEGVRLLVTVLATASLLAYMSVVVFGLATPFRRTQAARRAEAINTVISVSVQTYTAVIAAVLVILPPLFEEILG